MPMHSCNCKARIVLPAELKKFDEPHRKQYGCVDPKPWPDVDTAAKFHDKKYGTGMRVHNKRSNGQLRCTVCGDVK